MYKFIAFTERTLIIGCHILSLTLRIVYINGQPAIGESTENPADPGPYGEMTIRPLKERDDLHSGDPGCERLARCIALRSLEKENL